MQGTGSACGQLKSETEKLRTRARLAVKDMPQGGGAKYGLKYRAVVF
jgi:hypothetical protein